LLLVVVFVVVVAGHGILVQPTPRAGTDQGTGDKIQGSSATNDGSNTCAGPSGGAGEVAGAIQATYQAGSQIKVTWDTTIPHASPPGVRIAIRYQPTDSFDDNILAQGLDVGAKGCHSTTVTLLANKTCDDCVLQWMWESSADGGYYLGCSDIKIQTAAVAAGTNSDAYLSSICGADSSEANQQPNPSTPTTQQGMTPGGKAALSLFLLAIAAGFVATIVFVKGGYGTIDGKFPFYHRKSKVIADQRSAANYVAYVDDA